MDPQALLRRALPTVRQAWSTRDTILYALAVGAAQGDEALEEAQLRFVYEPQRQALPTLCAVLGDPGPLHVEPAAAHEAGFARPILHGMCSFGVLALLVVNHFCGARPQRLAALRARFTAPVYPGETLVCEFWRAGLEVRFRATALECGAVALNLGWARLHLAAL